jgi:hypothetical protein
MRTTRRLSPDQVRSGARPAEARRYLDAVVGFLEERAHA